MHLYILLISAFRPNTYNTCNTYNSYSNYSTSSNYSTYISILLLLSLPLISPAWQGSSRLNTTAQQLLSGIYLEYRSAACGPSIDPGGFEKASKIFPFHYLTALTKTRCFSQDHTHLKRKTNIELLYIINIYSSDYLTIYIKITIKGYLYSPSPCKQVVLLGLEGYHSG